MSQFANIQTATHSVTSVKQALSSDDQKVTQSTKRIKSIHTFYNHNYVLPELAVMERQCAELKQAAEHAEHTKSQINADLTRQLQTASHVNYKRPNHFISHSLCVRRSISR